MIVALAHSPLITPYGIPAALLTYVLVCLLSLTLFMHFTSQCTISVKVKPLPVTRPSQSFVHLLLKLFEKNLEGS